MDLLKNQTPSVIKFAKLIKDIIDSDRDVIVATGGFTGIGKSCLMTQIHETYAILTGTYWGFDRMTWSNKELLKWIDGEGKDHKGRLKEGSSILVDELFRLFYRRLWFEKTRISTIAVLNMFRDRHLFVSGNIPNFWDLDPAFTSRVRFYIFVKERGHAWVFMQEENPFNTDAWNVSDNKRLFRKYRNPSRIPNFLMSIYWNDWSAKQKKEYYEIRNTKRLQSEEEYKDEQKLQDKYTDIKRQRDIAIRGLFEYDKKLTNVKVADMIGLSHQHIRDIRYGT